VIDVGLIMSKRSIFHLTTLVLVATAIAGCASAPKQPIPRRGELVAQGAGELSFRSPDAGLVSVYDVNSDSLVHSSAVVRGTLVIVNPAAGNITVADADRPVTQVVNTGISKSHRYEMWFIPVKGGTYTATAPSDGSGR
jgi:hypothetical protein